ncbi:MAG: TIR domain-containing protein [Terracidiphilus sp.]
MESDPLLVDFCNELASTVRRIMSSNEEYFFDSKNIPPGAEWPRTLEDALQTVRSMLCFYSPKYFNSPDCGREMKAFRLRLHKFREANPGKEGFGPLGLLWESEIDIKSLIPPQLQDLQYNLPHWDGGDVTRTDQLRKRLSGFGLRYILQRASAGQNQDKVDRVDIINYYAQHIKKITQSCDLSAYAFEGEYKQLQPEFPAERGSNAPAAHALSGYGLGPKFVKVLFLVGKANEISRIEYGRNLRYYDEHDERLWKPFLPGLEEEIVILVNRAITSEKAIAESIVCPTIPDESKLTDVLRQVKANNNVLVVIVDPWSSYIPEFRPSLGVINERRLINLALFLPWNDEDEETHKHASELMERLNTSFEDLQEGLQLEEMIYHSPDELERQLRAKIVLIQSKIVARAAKTGSIRPLPGGTPLPTFSVAPR